MPSRKDTSPSKAQLGEDPTSLVPAAVHAGDSSASLVIESPQQGQPDPLDAHDFASGGGSGGAANFSRRNLAKKRR